MSLKKNVLTAAALAVALSVGGSASSALAQGAKGLDAFAGRWQMNAEKTQMGRMGPNGANIRRSPTFTWMFTPKPYGLQMDVYAEYPQPKPTRTMTVNVDAKKHPCQGPGPCLTTGGDPKQQFYTYYKMDDHMLARLFYDKGQVVEYSSYSVSRDGKTLAIVSWTPETPEFHNIQVFDKQP